MNPNHYLAVAIQYLFANRPGWSEDAAIGKTLVSSSMIDRVAASLDRRLIEVPVGFKWFVPGLLDGSVGFGGEESAGASFLQRDGSAWTTDKDGIILNLLASEILAVTGKTPSQHYAELTSEFGAPAYARIDSPATREQKAVLAKLSPSQVTASELAGNPITDKLTSAPGNDAAIGGLKVVTERGWFAARPSGTEDVYKLYAESFDGPEHLARIQEEAKAIVLGRVGRLGRPGEFVQDEDGLGRQHVRHGLEGVEHQFPHAGRVGRPHQEHQVVVARYQRAVPDLRDLGDPPAHRLPRMLADLQVHVGRDAEAVPFRIDGRAVAGDHAGLGEPLDPGVRAGSRDVQALSQPPHRQPPVPAQLVDDGPIGVIQHDRTSDLNRFRSLWGGHVSPMLALPRPNVWDSRPILEERPSADQTKHMTLVNFGAMLPTGEPRQLIDPDGRPTGAEPLPSVDVLLDLHRRMVLGRRFDSQATALTKQGRLAVYPSARGQEACQVGGVAALADRDWLFPTYRDSMAMVSRGINPVEVLTLLRGDWHCGYDPFLHRTATQCTPLATNTLHAVGLGHAAKLSGEDTVALALLGDGATSEGDTHEALNIAAVWQAPVVFLVQNNGYAISVPLSKQTRANHLADKGVGYGMPGVLIDGNDAAMVYRAVTEAVDRARAGAGPTLIEAITYRMEPHTNADDASRYRSSDEVDSWLARDPIDRLQNYLLSNGILDQAGLTDITGEAEARAERLRAAMNADPVLDPAELFEHVYAEPTPQLRRQAAQLASELDAS